jgi:hypothetical protein
MDAGKDQHLVLNWHANPVSLSQAFRRWWDLANQRHRVPGSRTPQA